VSPARIRRDQRIRVEAAAECTLAEDIRDVFSYDLITIRVIVAQEHIALVEMLAERIAAVILTYARVTSATVRVEKLGPGGAGVEIVRHPVSEVAKVHQLCPAGGAEANPKVGT
jgi:dihydroneopterin aldolase